MRSIVIEDDTDPCLGLSTFQLLGYQMIDEGIHMFKWAASDPHLPPPPMVVHAVFYEEDRRLLYKHSEGINYFARGEDVPKALAPFLRTRLIRKRLIPTLRPDQDHSYEYRTSIAGLALLEYLDPMIDFTGIPKTVNLRAPAEVRKAEIYFDDGPACDPKVGQRAPTLDIGGSPLIRYSEVYKKSDHAFIGQINFEEFPWQFIIRIAGETLYAPSMRDAKDLLLKKWNAVEVEKPSA